VHDVPVPHVTDATDAVIKITSTAICGWASAQLPAIWLGLANLTLVFPWAG
jgi:hypothetical protein